MRSGETITARSEPVHSTSGIWLNCLMPKLLLNALAWALARICKSTDKRLPYQHCGWTHLHSCYQSKPEDLQVNIFTLTFSCVGEALAQIYVILISSWKGDGVCSILSPVDPSYCRSGTNKFSRFKQEMDWYWIFKVLHSCEFCVLSNSIVWQAVNLTASKAQIHSDLHLTTLEP